MARANQWVAICALLFLAFQAKASTDAAIFITGMILLVGLDRGNRHG